MLTNIFSRTMLAQPAPFTGVDTAGWPWKHVVRLAHHHLLAPRLYAQLRESNVLNQAPASAAASLSHGALEAAQSHTLHEALAPKLLTRLEALGCRPVVLKGFLLARLFYEHPEQRPFHDLDLLFRPEQREATERFFEGNGFCRSPGNFKFEANAHKTEYVYKSNPALIVECHYQLGYGKFTTDDVWDRIKAYTLKTPGSEATVWHLAPEDEYLFLVFHAAIQHRFQKLGWLLDLAMMQRKSALSTAKLQAQARLSNLEPALGATHYFLKHFAQVPHLGELPPNPRLDRWFARITDGSIENSLLKKAGLRALTQGSWLSLLQYGAQRQWALVRK